MNTVRRRRTNLWLKSRGWEIVWYPNSGEPGYWIYSHPQKIGTGDIEWAFKTETQTSTPIRCLTASTERTCA